MLLGVIVLAPVTETLKVRFWPPWCWLAWMMMPPTTTKTTRTPIATARRARLISSSLYLYALARACGSVRAEAQRGRRSALGQRRAGGRHEHEVVVEVRPRGDTP